MELKFKPERLTIIRRLKGITTTDIERSMREIGNYQNKVRLYTK